MLDARARRGTEYWCVAKQSGRRPGSKELRDEARLPIKLGGGSSVWSHRNLGTKMSKNKKGNREIQYFALMARQRKYYVTGGVNGGGWTRLAAAIGVPGCNKTQARAALARLFGEPPATWGHHSKSKRTTADAKWWNERPKFLVDPFSDDFYATREWRELRYQALQANNGKCQCCGRTPAHGIVLHVDHIKPKSKFPHLALTLANLQVLCADCNIGKSNKDDTDWASLRAEEEAQTVILIAAKKAIDEGVS